MRFGRVIPGCPDPLGHTGVLMPTTSGSSELPSTLVESTSMVWRVCSCRHPRLSSQHPFLGESGMPGRARVRIWKSIYDVPGQGKR